jgi:hypothetical protein
MTESTWTSRCQELAGAITEACTIAQVAGGPGVLAKEINTHLPDLPFKRILCRGGWYRLGGLVDKDGRHISHDLASWVEAELAARNDDFSRLVDDYAGSGLCATRLVGRTHYLAAPVGNGATDYLQLEVEDLQEVRGHELFTEEHLPASVEELIDPRESGNNGLPPIGLPYYAFRRLSHIGETLAQMQDKQTQPLPITRFFEDWANSSAGQTTAIYNHWVIALREYLDRYRQKLVRAQPVPALIGEAPVFNVPQGTNGLALQQALQTFDRQAGYPFAWFFTMLGGNKVVPHWVAQTVVEDALVGFAYLPGRDAAIVRNWLHRPYSV